MTGEVHGIQKESIRVCCVPGLTPIPSEGREEPRSCLQQFRAESLVSDTLILDLDSASLEMVVSRHMPGGHVRKTSKRTSRAARPGFYPLNKACVFCAAVCAMFLSCLDFP